MNHPETSPVIPPEGGHPQPTAQGVSPSYVYIPAKLMSGLSAGLAFVASVESVVGAEAVSTFTLRVAGIVAVGAAFGGVGGFLLDRYNRL